MKPVAISRRRARGFSMVEVLVSMVIAAIGLLGFAKLQAAALSNSQTARTRSLVAVQTASLAAAMNVSVSLVTLEQNEVVKRLAGWAALLAVPTLLTGWFGMNFHHMPELDWRWAYPSLIVFTLGLCGGLYYALKRSRWL